MICCFRHAKDEKQDAYCLDGVDDHDLVCITFGTL